MDAIYAPWLRDAATMPFIVVHGAGLWRLKTADSNAGTFMHRYDRGILFGSSLLFLAMTGGAADHATSLADLSNEVLLPLAHFLFIDCNCARN